MLDSTSLTIDNTGLISVQTSNPDHIGINTVVITVTLSDYPTIVLSLSMQVTILPCIVTSAQVVR